MCKVRSLKLPEKFFMQRQMNVKSIQTLMDFWTKQQEKFLVLSSDVIRSNTVRHKHYVTSFYESMLLNSFTIWILFIQNNFEKSSSWELQKWVFRENIARSSSRDLRADFLNIYFIKFSWSRVAMVLFISKICFPLPKRTFTFLDSSELSRPIPA